MSVAAVSVATVGEIATVGVGRVLLLWDLEACVTTVGLCYDCLYHCS